MYSGARTQLGDGASPFVIPNIGIDASQHAIQRGTVTLDETVKQYFKIQDFGEEQRIESEVRGLLTKFDVEFQRRASLAPGSSSQALYMIPTERCARACCRICPMSIRVRLESCKADLCCRRAA